jgi:hypothetical protein
MTDLVVSLVALAGDRVSIIRLGPLLTYLVAGGSARC